MLYTLKAHKHARHIPDHITSNLPYQTTSNNRLCNVCYFQLSPQPTAMHALITAAQQQSSPQPHQQQQEHL